MKDKLIRAQQFVYRHRGTFGYAAGIGVGCVVIATAKRHPVHMMMITEWTTEKCVEVLKENGGLSIIDELGNRISIVASDCPALTP